jgi:hypothetical protein
MEVNMSNKNIVFTAPFVTEIIDYKMPEIDSGKVLVKIVRSSISAGTMSSTPGWWG